MCLGGRATVLLLKFFNFLKFYTVLKFLGTVKLNRIYQIKIVIFHQNKFIKCILKFN